MTPDRHLGAAWIDRCRPDLLITESTYATTIRDSKRCRERDFLKKVHDSIEKGGKVSCVIFDPTIIPVSFFCAMVVKSAAMLFHLILILLVVHKI